MYCLPQRLNSMSSKNISHEQYWKDQWWTFFKKPDQHTFGGSYTIISKTKINMVFDFFPTPLKFVLNVDFSLWGKHLTVQYPINKNFFHRFSSLCLMEIIILVYENYISRYYAFLFQNWTKNGAAIYPQFFFYLFQTHVRTSHLIMTNWLYLVVE